uniref:MACPF domain-containing protein n=1 Tax=Macrostomum lignano TaxID=282301 RepID=A0A1I8H5V1_9PLAT
MLSTIELAASAKADFRSGERKQSMQQNSESVYAKCTVHTVPTAACLLECSNLHLSGRAIEELQNIEAMMTCKSDVTEEATNFFDQYGSHAIAGMIHFGGVHITTAHALYQSSSNLEMIKNSVSKALATAVKGGNLFIKGEPSDAGVASSSEDNTADKREKQSSNVQLKSQMFGGAPGASSVSKWCEGLVQDSSTWAVIDGSSDTVPVWQIVKANGQHFQDADALANALKKSWEERTGQKAPAESSDSYRQAVSCVQQRIDEFAQRVEKENLSEENWHLQLQTFCSFPMKGRLYFQLACEQDENYSKLTDMGLDCPLKLAEAVEQTVLPDLQAFNVQHEGDSEKQRKVLQLVFVDLNTAVQHLLRRLKESGDAEKHFLTCTALARNSYSLQNDIFENLKNPESLQHLAQSLKESAQQLSVIKESSEPEFVQARLLHTAMDARFDDGCCFQVADWILLFQQCGIQWIALLNEKLTDIAYNSSKAWRELNEVVTHLLSNFSDNRQPLQLPENMVSKLRDAQSNTSEVVVPNSDKQQLDKDGMALIQRLGLAEYFPSKIGLIDVMKVGDEMYSAATDVTQLPQKILKSIIQADYKSGFEIVEACNISPSEGKKAVSQSFWDDEDDQDDMAHEAKKLHYSDVLLACLLSCNMRLQQLLAEKLNDCKHAFPIASACAGSLELR